MNDRLWNYPSYLLSRYITRRFVVGATFQYAFSYLPLIVSYATNLIHHVFIHIIVYPYATHLIYCN